MSLKKLHFLVPALISSVLVLIGYIVINGLPLMHMPELEEIAYVEILDRSLDSETRIFTNEEDIEIAINVTNFLLYKPGKIHSQYSFDKSYIEMVFHLKDETTVTIQADDFVVSNNGTKYHLKEDSGTTFIKITEGIFFFDSLAEEM